MSDVKKNKNRLKISRDKATPDESRISFSFRYLTTNSKFNFDLITDQVTIPIKNIYIGDSNNTAQLCNAYLYDETKSAWVNVNTGEVLN